MKRILMLLGMSLGLLGASAWAQRPDQQRSEPMDSRAEKSVHIVRGPEVRQVSEHSAVIWWVTDKAGANHVRYRADGQREWQSAYHQGGGNEHELRLSGLQEHRRYEWQILTQDGDVRQQGEFHTK